MVQPGEAQQPEHDIRRPHRQWSRHDELVGERLTRNEADIINGEDTEAHPDDEAHTRSREPNRHRHGDDYKYQRRCSHSVLLVYFDKIIRRTDSRAACAIAERVCGSNVRWTDSAGVHYAARFAGVLVLDGRLRGGVGALLLCFRRLRGKPCCDVF